MVVFAVRSTGPTLFCQGVQNFSYCTLKKGVSRSRWSSQKKSDVYCGGVHSPQESFMQS